MNRQPKIPESGTLPVGGRDSREPTQQFRLNRVECRKSTKAGHRPPGRLNSPIPTGWLEASAWPKSAPIAAKQATDCQAILSRTRPSSPSLSGCTFLMEKTYTTRMADAILPILIAALYQFGSAIFSFPLWQIKFHCR